LIQTNKASYRPGHFVKYRILVLDADTRPIAVLASLTVALYDAEKHLIRQVIGQSTTNGVYSGEFPTTADDKQGIWTIEAALKNKVS
jgi:CD109 antigen